MKRQRKNRNSLNFETLENRNLMAAVGFEAANLDHATTGSANVVEARPYVEGPTARIVNGVQTDQFEAVGLLNGDCTGTLISPTHVLTAAHCVPGMADNAATFEVGGRTYNSV